MTEKWLSLKRTKILFALSVVAVVGLEVRYANPVGVLLNIPVAFILALYLENKHKILYRLFAVRGKRHVLVSAPVAVFITASLALSFKQHTVDRAFLSSNPLSDLVRSYVSEPVLQAGLTLCVMIGGLAALLAVYALTYAVVSRFSIQKIAEAVRSAEPAERFYVVAGLILFTVLIIAAYSSTSVFYSMKDDYNIIFTTDSPTLIRNDAFFMMNASENDLRQPLFALVTIPFSILAKMLAALLFFVPNIYLIALQLMLVAMLLVMAVLILRMLELRDKLSRIAFLALYSLTFPVLMYSMVVEQYIPSTFMAVLAIYITMYQKKKSPALLALASGTLLTNAVLVPFATFESKPSQWIRAMCKVAAAFLVMCVFCCKLPTLLDGVKSLTNYVQYTGMSAENPVRFIDTLYQFTVFIKNCFIAPVTTTVAEPLMTLGSAGALSSIIVTRLALTQPPGIDWAGVGLLALAACGFVLNRKQLFVKLCGLWCLMAAGFLLALGWSAPENGMILYSLYFSWAFFSLIFKLFDRIFENHKPVKYILYCVALIVLVYFNFPGIKSLVDFGIVNYPVL